MTARRPVVLMYHGIAEVPAADDPANAFVPPAAFAAQLDLLDRLGSTVVDESRYLAILDGAPPPPNPVLLTFDDGYVSTLTEAAPLLAARGMPATCFLSAGLLGRAPLAGRPEVTRLLGAAEVTELADHGITVGCHGWAHDSMTGMSPAGLGAATVQAGQRLEQLTGRSVRTFAYPYGDHDGPARAAVASAGYQAAFATYSGDGRFAIPRVDVNATDTPRSFRMKLMRVYPLTRRALSVAPRARRLAHRAVGYAERS